jgi:hypothetical protein
VVKIFEDMNEVNSLKIALEKRSLQDFCVPKRKDCADLNDARKNSLVGFLRFVLPEEFPL